MGAEALKFFKTHLFTLQHYVGKMRLLLPPIEIVAWKGSGGNKKEFGLLFRRGIEEEEAVVAALLIRSGGREGGREGGGQSLAIKTDNNSLSLLLGLLPFLLPLLLWMKMERAGKKGGEGDSTMIEMGNKGWCFLFTETKTFDFYWLCQ